ncbi:MAG: DUF3108 domain-containing protein [Burkholderiaceae bacterium]
MRKSSQSSPLSQPRFQPKRWLVLLFASALLHVVLLNLAGWQIGIRAPAPQPPQHSADSIVSVQLHQLPEMAARPAAAVPQRAVQRPPAKPKPRPAPAPVAAAPSAAAIIAATAPETAALLDQMEGMEVPGSSIEPAIVLPAQRTGPDADAGAEPATEPATKPVTESAVESAAASTPQRVIDPPPPVLLKYEVQSSKDGKAVYGSGKIAWSTDGKAYSISGEASVLFFNVLEFSSEGAIDRFGVAPLLYTEKRFRKPATNTHFRREPKIVSFSASTMTYPRQGGEQDRASITWQLAALGRGDSSLFVPGAQIEMMVAGVRDAEIWSIRVIGLEQLRIPAGEMPAWHLVRQPRADSFGQTIDIWLAPQQQWYPVRMRFTEHNGDYLDMAASAIDIAPSAPSAVIQY